MHPADKPFLNFVRSPLGVGCGVVVLAGAGTLFGIGIDLVVRPKLEGGPIPALVVSGLVFLGIAWAVKRIWEQSRMVENRASASWAAPQKTCLIGFLSAGGEAFFREHGADGDAETGACLGGDDLLADLDCARAAGRWNWAPLLELMHHHADGPAGPLRKVIIIGSAGENATAPLVPEFLELAWGYFRGHPFPVEFEAYAGPETGRDAAPVGVDFENFEEITRALESVRNRLVAEGYRPSQIAIDLTGGTKICGLAAMAVTLDSDIANNYVSQNQTDPATGRPVIREYDYTGRTAGDPG